MKRISSIWMAAAKTLWWKLLLILVLMAAGEILLLNRAIHLYVQTYEGYRQPSFQHLIRDAKIYLVFFAAVVALSACCCLQGCRFGGKNQYLLQRLPLAEWQVTALWAVVHLACFAILWAGQLAAVILLWNRYIMEFPASSQGLALLVAFYDNGFLHGLLPLRDGVRWLLVLGYWPAMAWLTASFSFFQRRDKSLRIGLLLLLFVYFMLMQEPGNAATTVLFFVFLLLVLAGNIHGMWGAYHEANTN